MSIDTKALPIWGWIAHHRESGGRPIIADPGRAAMLPSTEGWDVFPVCRVDDAADRLAALEAELASLRTDRDGAAEACRMLQEDKARLEQDNARLREALAPVANSHTDNEGTDRPVWWILDPQQMMRACPHRLYSMFHGPFWSREEAERFFKATRYRYGSRAVVYCGSAHQSPQMRALFDSSAALAAGGDQ